MADLTKGLGEVCLEDGNRAAVMRVFARFVKSQGDCWVWTGKRSSGRGRFMVNRKHYWVHRWVYEHFIGALPARAQVKQTCGNPACVNPAHLAIRVRSKYKCIRAPTMERFLQRIRVQSDTGCWIWLGAKDRGGYGHLSDGGVSHLAHRWIYEQRVGSIPEGLEIDHICRVRECVNPDHLEAVSHLENMRRGHAARRGL